jgi:hypothetical protein
VLLDGAPLSYFGISRTKARVFGGTPQGVRASDGRFELRHVTPGTWRISLLGPGTRLKIVEDVVVEAGQTVALGDVAMERGHRVTGQVRDRSNAVVVGVSVHVGHWVRLPGLERSILENSFFGRFEATTDANGAYAFDGIDAHQMPRLPHIWATHPSTGVSLIRELRPTEDSIDFVLVATGHIEVAVEGLRGGRPVAHAVRDDEPEYARMGFLDDSGRKFRFEDLPIGEYVVCLDEGASDVPASASATVVANTTTRVTLAITSSSVRLTVRLPRGRSRDLIFEPTSEGAGVGGRMRMVSTHATEDACTLEFVRPGSYRASLDGKQWSAITIASRPSEQMIDLRQLV